MTAAGRVATRRPALPGVRVAPSSAADLVSRPARRLAGSGGMGSGFLRHRERNAGPVDRLNRPRVQLDQDVDYDPTPARQQRGRLLRKRDMERDGRARPDHQIDAVVGAGRHAAADAVPTEVVREEDDCAPRRALSVTAHAHRHRAVAVDQRVVTHAARGHPRASAKSACLLAERPAALAMRRVAHARSRRRGCEEPAQDDDRHKSCSTQSHHEPSITLARRLFKPAGLANTISRRLAAPFALGQRWCAASRISPRC